MENNLTSANDTVYRDAARSFAFAEIEKIDSILDQNYPEFIKRKCTAIKDRLNDDVEKIQDQDDLLNFQSLLDFISELVDTFLTSNQSKSSWWAMPLINECYDRCGISRDNREILIIHYLNSTRRGYGVFPNLLGLPGLSDIIASEKIIDVFDIPSEAKYDIASIALIGHEIGHVYWSKHYEQLEDYIYKKFDEKFKAETLLDIEDLRGKRDKIASHIEEFLCDKVGRYLMGPAFDFALLKLFIGSQNEEDSLTHPKDNIRIIQSIDNLDVFASEGSDIRPYVIKLVEYFKDLREQNGKIVDGTMEETFALNLANEITLSEELKQACTEETVAAAWKFVVPELDAFRPPFERVGLNRPAAISPIDAVLITSLYYYGKHYQRSNEYYLHTVDSDVEKEDTIRRKLVEHLRYAISLYDFVKSAQKKYCGPESKTDYVHQTIWSMRERDSGGDPNPFVVVPSTSPSSQYSSVSVDLRLGNSFLVNKTTRYTHISPAPDDDESAVRVPIEAFYDEIFVPVADDFILHPHQFVLAATLEYVSVPYDYYALVMGRSSWGRLGLNIATATTVHSGFRGCITLELRNLGETPLPLKVGLRVAQLCLVPVPTNLTQKGYFTTTGKYIGPVGPEIPKIKSDSDWELLKLARVMPD